MSYLILVLLSLTSFQVFSQTTSLPWWSVNATDMQSANCKTLSVPSMDQLEADINQSRDQVLKSEQVFGASIENESSALISALKNLTTRTDVWGGTWKKPKEAQINLQDEFSINPTCNKVLCAVKRIWGDELGIKVLWIYLKHGYNTSELAFDSAERFEIDEIDDVIMTLEDLPSNLVPLAFQKNQRLAPAGKILSSNVVANSAITLMDSWRQKSSMIRQMTLYHEFGHNMSSRHLSKENLKEWQNLEPCLLSEYSKESPGEDFAESVIAYRYKSDDLKLRCPSKYEFIRTRVFQKEFLNSNECAK